jgi:hypothetical protein
VSILSLPTTVTHNGAEGAMSGLLTVNRQNVSFDTIISGQLSYVLASDVPVNVLVQGNVALGNVNAYRFICSTGGMDGSISLFGVR